MADSKKGHFSKSPILDIFCEKILSIGGFENLSFSAILEFFFQKKNFFASSPWKSVKIYRVAWMGLKFDDYPKNT